MALAYINKTIPVPNPKTQDINYVALVDNEYTAGHQLRQDGLGIKRVWEFQCDHLTPSEYDAIESHLMSTNFGRTYFWYDEFGGNATNDSIEAFISIVRDEREAFGKDGTWYTNGKNITLEIIEA